MGFRARSLHCALEHVRRRDAGTQGAGGKIMRVGSHHAFEELWAYHAEGGIMRTWATQAGRGEVRRSAGGKRRFARLCSRP